MRRYRKVSKEEKIARREREQNERLRAEMRELALREVKNALQTALRDAEKELERSVRSIEQQSGRLIFRNQTSTGGSNSANDTSPLNFGTLISGSLLRLFKSRERTRTSQAPATETTRSSEENQFYRESRSQREVSISNMTSSSRNL